MVKFIEHGSVTSGDHVTGTKCRPDLIAKSADSPSNQALQSPDAPTRGYLHLAGRRLKNCHTSQDHHSHTIHYQNHQNHLRGRWSLGSKWKALESFSRQERRCQARYCIYIIPAWATSRSGCRPRSLHFASPLLANVHESMFRWNDESARNLFFRVLYYINDPPVSMIDPTITRKDGTFYNQCWGQGLQTPIVWTLHRA